MTILLREQEQLIAAKLEVTYGVDPTPAGANAIMVQDISVNLLEGTVEQRKNLMGFMGNQGSVRLNQFVTVNFSVELAGSGAVDTPPYFSVLYKSSGHGQVITADTSVDYTIATGDLDSMTIYYFVGEHLHRITGIRGTIGFEAGTKQLPRLKFTGIGLYNAGSKVDGGLAGVDFSNVLKPLPWTKANVPTLSLFEENINAASYSFEQGQPPEFLALIAGEEVVMPNRSAKLTVKIREDDIETVDWFEKSRTGDTDAFDMQHGVDEDHDGRIFQLNAPNVDVMSVSRSFEQGIAMLTLVCGVIPTAKGNDYTFSHL